MKNRVWIVLGAVVIAGMTAVSSANAAAYIKFDGVDGESVSADHNGWCDVISYSQRLHKPGGGTAASRRRAAAVLEDIVVVKELDKASPRLAESVCRGEVFRSVLIHVTANVGENGEEVPYLQYELKNVQIVSYSISGTGRGDVVPTDQISLNYEEIKVTYIARNGVDIVEYQCAKETAR